MHIYIYYYAPLKFSTIHRWQDFVFFLKRVHLIYIYMFVLNHHSKYPCEFSSWCIVRCWVVVSNIFHFHPYLGKWSNSIDILQMGWNHQPGWAFFCLALKLHRHLFLVALVFPFGCLSCGRLVAMLGRMVKFKGLLLLMVQKSGDHQLM